MPDHDNILMNATTTLPSVNLNLICAMFSFSQLSTEPSTSLKICSQWCLITWWQMKDLRTLKQKLCHYKWKRKLPRRLEMLEINWRNVVSNLHLVMPLVWEKVCCCIAIFCIYIYIEDITRRCEDMNWWVLFALHFAYYSTVLRCTQWTELDFPKLTNNLWTKNKGNQYLTRGHSIMHTSASGPAVISCWERTNYLFCNVSQQQV